MKAGLYIERYDDFIAVQLECELVQVKGTAKKLKAESPHGQIGKEPPQDKPWPANSFNLIYIHPQANINIC